MTVDQILKLIDAGYTKAEIETMSTAPAADPAPAPDAAPAPAAQPQQAPAAAPEPPKAESDAQRILKALGDLAKGVDVPPTHDMTIEEKLGNSILTAMGIKSKEE